MATYTRTIAGMAATVPAQPGWRQAMTSTRTIYSVGPESVNAVLRPISPAPIGGVVPPRFTNLREDALIHFGWNGSCFVPDAGFAGKLVYFGAGENYWGNAATAFDLQDAQWEWWQDNYFCTSLAQAVAEDADAYYSPADAAALPVNRQFAENEAWYASWDKGFPVAHGGWVYRRKFTSFTHGRGRHWTGRYNTVCAVPQEMTRTGRSAVIINGQSWRGPFSQGPTPSGYRPYSDWVAEVDSGGRSRGYVYWQDILSREWNRIATPVPGATSSGVYEQASVVDTAYKRVYYFNATPAAGLYYLDLSSGIANATMSSLMPLTAVPSSTSTNLSVEDRTSVAFTDGHPQGRRLIYFRAEPYNSDQGNRLVMIDLDTNRIYALGPIPGLDMDRPGFTKAHCGMAYVATQNSLVLTTKAADRGPLMHIIPIPSDPTATANYSAQTIQLSLASGVSLEKSTSGDYNIFMYGQGKGGYNPALGVVMTPQVNGPLLAYRPF